MSDTQCAKKRVLSFELRFAHFDERFAANFLKKCLTSATLAEALAVTLISEPFTSVFVVAATCSVCTYTMLIY